MIRIKTAVLTILLTHLAFAITKADDGHELWLKKRVALPVHVICAQKSAVLDIAINELKADWAGTPNATCTLRIKPAKSAKKDGFILENNTISSNSELGLLYGVYDLLRRQAIGEKPAKVVSDPSYMYRILNHWDNLNGSVERGYAGRSIFWRDEKDALTVTAEDKTRWRAYARANASIGINGTVLNNVNASPLILTANHLKKVKAIADILRPYGVKAYLSVNFSSPVKIGGLKTADPLDPAVKKKKFTNQFLILAASWLRQIARDSRDLKTLAVRT
jgi:alpha-glucuronidase